MSDSKLFRKCSKCGHDIATHKLNHFVLKDIEISRSDFFDMIDFLCNKRNGIKNDNEKNAFGKFLSQPKEQKKVPHSSLVSEKIHSINSQNSFKRSINNNNNNSNHNNSANNISNNLKPPSVLDRRVLLSQPKTDINPKTTPRANPKKIDQEKLSQFNQLKFTKNQ